MFQTRFEIIGERYRMCFQQVVVSPSKPKTEYKPKLTDRATKPCDTMIASGHGGHEESPREERVIRSHSSLAKRIEQAGTATHWRLSTAEARRSTPALLSPEAETVRLPYGVACYDRPMALKGLSSAQKIGLLLAAVLYIVAGSLHFIKPEAYVRIMPPYVPWHLPMVFISGAFEILGGIGLLVPQTRGNAAWGLVALLIVVFPANLYMATNPVDTGATSIAPIFRWGRLPLQLFLIWWLLWCSRPRTVFA